MSNDNEQTMPDVAWLWIESSGEATWWATDPGKFAGQPVTIYDKRDAAIRKKLAGRVRMTIDWIIDGDNDWTTGDEIQILRDLLAYLSQPEAE